jgi:hypothetical protein
MMRAHVGLTSTIGILEAVDNLGAIACRDAEFGHLKFLMAGPDRLR